MKTFLGSHLDDPIDDPKWNEADLMIATEQEDKLPELIQVLEATVANQNTRIDGLQKEINELEGQLADLSMNYERDKADSRHRSVIADFIAEMFKAIISECSPMTSHTGTQLNTYDKMNGYLCHPSTPFQNRDAVSNTFYAGAAKLLGVNEDAAKSFIASLEEFKKARNSDQHPALGKDNVRTAIDSLFNPDSDSFKALNRFWGIVSLPEKQVEW